MLMIYGRGHATSESQSPGQPQSTSHSCREKGVTYKFGNRGALLSLPNGGQHEDVIRTKPFEDYIRDHATLWFNWARRIKLSVERTEDLILVSGCTLVTSWAAAEFVSNTEGEISLASRTVAQSVGSGTRFFWRDIRGPVVYRNSQYDAVRFKAYPYLACTDFFFFVWKGKSTHDPESMRFHQGIPSN